MPSKCKSCENVITVGSGSFDGVNFSYYFECKTCNIQTACDNSLIAATILWNLYNTGSIGQTVIQEVENVKTN